MLKLLRLMLCGRLASRSSQLPVESFPSFLGRKPARLLIPFETRQRITQGPLQIRSPRTLSPARLRLILITHAAQLGMTGPTKRAHPEGGQDGKQQQGGRKKRPMPPEIQVRLAIQMAAKEGNVEKAFQAYEGALKDGIKVNIDSYASIFYLCSGGDAWETMLAGATQLPQQQQGENNGNAAPADEGSGEEKEAVQQSKVTPEIMDKARRMMQRMQTPEFNIKPNEMCFTGLARMAALSSNPTEAFSVAKDMIAQGLTPRLRSFTPALAGFAEAGDHEKAFEVDTAISEAGIELTEAEYGRLLQAAASGASWEQAKNVLERMAQDLTELQPSTLERIKAYFSSPAAQSAFATTDHQQEQQQLEQQKWEIGPCAVDSEGVCDVCDGVLQPIDLSEEEYAAFRDGVAAIARKHERQPNDFESFKSWLEQHGPFHAVVDAANVAFYGQNFESGGFNFSQIQAVVNHLKSRHSDSPLLAVLHVNRTKGPAANKEEAKKLLTGLQEEHSFYATPQGSNDDWYWIYAAVAAGSHGMLVSNDEMRDHIFQLLAPKFFLKWKQRHQLRYKFGTAGLTIEYPPPYTTCIQQLSTGTWVFPSSDGTWLCARPVSA